MQLFLRALTGQMKWNGMPYLAHRCWLWHMCCRGSWEKMLQSSLTIPPTPSVQKWQSWNVSTSKQKERVFCSSNVPRRVPTTGSQTSYHHEKWKQLASLGHITFWHFLTELRLEDKETWLRSSSSKWSSGFATWILINLRLSGKKKTKRTLKVSSVSLMEYVNWLLETSFNNSLANKHYIKSK